MSLSPNDRDLDRNPANFQPLTPLTFLERSVAVFPDRLAIAHEIVRRSYSEFHARTKKLASALAKRGFARGDTVAVVLANAPAMLESRYGVPMCGAVLNTRLDAASIAFMLDHGEANTLIVDREFSAVIGAALKWAKARPLVIDYDDPEYDSPGTAGRSRLRGARVGFFYCRAQRPPFCRAVWTHNAMVFARSRRKRIFRLPQVTN
jgi:fatty-acyl-CoA synthase